MSTRNEQLFERAQRTIPGGVNSPVRAFRSVGGTPRFFTRGVGSRLWDADGTRYNKGKGLSVFVNGEKKSSRDDLGRLTIQLPPADK